MTLRKLIDRDTAEVRLKEIFPPGAFDTVLSSRQAASAVTAMIYVGAVVNDEGDAVIENVWARPSTVMWMSEQAMARGNDAQRLVWAGTATKTEKRLVELLNEWGFDHQPWYAANSRETLRDETWPKWRSHGAVRRREGVATSSSAPRWALTASFADLFDPDLSGDDLDTAITEWRRTHLTPGELLRIQYANDLAKAEHEVAVVIPGYGVRALEPGVASAILRGVVEEWAARRLDTPVVVAISEPGAKVWVMDAAKLAAAGISINVSSVLPDAIILDAGTKPPTFWIIEAVATDGEVDEDRKADLLAWAADQYINPDDCQFLSAFASRNSAPARKRLKDLAVGTYAWFLDEPGRELAWNELPDAKQLPAVPARHSRPG